LSFLPAFFSICSITLSSDSSSSTVIVDSLSAYGFFTVLTLVTEVESSEVFSSEPSAPTLVEVVAAGAEDTTGLTVGVDPAGVDFATLSKGASTFTG